MSHSIRIATWNLERPKAKGYQRNPQLLARLRAVDADIWILTETNRAISLEPSHVGRASVVDADTGWTYINNPHTEGENATTIWSRWPIRPAHIPTADDSVAVCVDIDSPLGVLRVYGTIITWHADRGAQGNSANWHEHYAAIKRQRPDWQRLASEQPLIVAGDFNTTLDGRYYGTIYGRGLLEEGLRDAKLHCATAALPETIDHICVPKDWARHVVGVERWHALTPAGKALSDHHGVTVDLRLDG